MVYEVSNLKVKDYEKWKTGFNEIISIIKDNGAKCRRIFRDQEDPNKVMVIIEWENLEKANKLTQDKEIMNKFQNLGILEVNIRHFEEIENKKL